MPVFAVRNVPKSMSILGRETLDEQINRHAFLYSHLRRFETPESTGAVKGNDNGADDDDNAAAPHFGTDDLNALHTQVAAAVKAAEEKKRDGKQKVVANKIFSEQLKPIVTAKCGVPMQRYVFRKRAHEPSRKLQMCNAKKNSTAPDSRTTSLAFGPRNFLSARYEIRQSKKRRHAPSAAAALLKSLIGDDAAGDAGTADGSGGAKRECRIKFGNAKLDGQFQELMAAIDVAVEHILETMAEACFMLTWRRAEQTSPLLRRFVRYELFSGDIMTNMTPQLMKKLLGLDDKSSLNDSNRTSAEQLQDLEFFMRFTTWMRDEIEPLTARPSLMALRAHIAATTRPASEQRALSMPTSNTNPITSANSCTSTFLLHRRHQQQKKRKHWLQTAVTQHSLPLLTAAEKITVPFSAAKKVNSNSLPPTKSGVKSLRWQISPAYEASPENTTNLNRRPSQHTVRQQQRQRQAQRLKEKYARLQPEQLFDADNDPHHAPASVAVKNYQTPSKLVTTKNQKIIQKRTTITAPALNVARDAASLKSKTSFEQLSKCNPDGFQFNTDVFIWTLPLKQRLQKNLEHIVDFSFGSHILHNEVVHQLAFEQGMTHLKEQIAAEIAHEESDHFWLTEKAAREKHDKIRTWTGSLI